MLVAFLLNSLHSVGYFWLRGIFTDSPMATGAFLALGSVLTFSPLMHSLVAPGLAGVEVDVDNAKVLLE